MRRGSMHVDLSGPAFFILFACLLCFSSCGKKGPLNLASYEKPEAPSLLSALHREDTIILSWTFPREKEREIEGFIIMRSSGGEFERLFPTEKQARTFSDADFAAGANYRYKVLSRNFRGILSEASNVVKIAPTPAPMPPRTISFRLANDSLYLSWENAGEGVRYNIYRSFEKGTYAPLPLNASPLAVTAFRDNFFPNRQVYYRIRSVSPNHDEGFASAEFTMDPALIAPPAPQELHCFATADRIYLYWKEPEASWVRGFRIYRKSGSGEYELVGETQLPSFSDADGPSQKKRDYRITAVGPSGEGPAAQLSGVCDKPE